MSRIIRPSDYACLTDPLQKQIDEQRNFIVQFTQKYKEDIESQNEKLARVLMQCDVQKENILSLRAMKQEVVAMVNEQHKKMGVEIYEAVRDGNKKVEKKIKDDMKKTREDGKDEFVELIEKVSEKEELKKMVDRMGKKLKEYDAAMMNLKADQE